METARAAYLDRLGTRLLGVRLPGAELRAVAAVESLPRLLASLQVASGDVAFTHVLEGMRYGSAVDPVEALQHLARLTAAGLAEQRAESEGTDQEPDAESGGAYSGSHPDNPDPAPAIAQWLRAFGPVPLALPKRVFGAAFAAVEEAVGELVEADGAILDVLSEDAEGPELCDAGNLEILLRLMRRRSRPEFRTLPAERLPLFLAAWQGVAEPSRDAEGLQNVMEKLFGYPAPAAAWEADILPARSFQYLPSRLDDLFRDSDLAWIGRGRERIAFAFPEDLDLFPPAAEDGPLPPDQDLVAGILEAAAPGRLDFQALSARCPLPSNRIADALWDLAWRGRITNDTYAALRKGIEAGFKAAPAPEAEGPRGSVRGRSRSGFQRWKAARPLAGAWQALESPVPAADALQREELAKDRVRQLLKRYGILFRELLVHELPDLQWGSLFRSLRLLELSGEVLSGHFFAGIPGLQFLAPQAMRALEAPPRNDAIHWMAATDPASPCAIGLEGLPYALPPRLSSTHLVFHGSDLALVSRRLGKDLAIRVPPRHKYLTGYLGALRHLVDRAFLPAKSLEVETVNGEPVMGSPYMQDLLEAGFEQGFRTVTLRRRY